MSAIPAFTKDPSAVTDYALDWSLWLLPGDSVVSASWTVSSGMTKNSESLVGAKSTVWVSGGTLLANYTLVCTITTAQGRTDQRSILIRCRDR